MRTLMNNMLVIFIIGFTFGYIISLIQIKVSARTIYKILSKTVQNELTQFKNISTQAIKSQILELRNSNKITETQIEKNHKKLHELNSQIFEMFNSFKILNNNVLALNDLVNKRSELEKEILKLKNIIKRKVI